MPRANGHGLVTDSEGWVGISGEADPLKEATDRSELVAGRAY
jgi:hypothetical protein